MKKDIEIPEVKDVYMAIVKEYNETFQCDDWNVYLVNNKPVDLEMVLIVSRGYDENNATSIIRRKLEKLPANSLAKIEMIQPELFKLQNEFQTTFFAENKMLEKSFIFERGSIKEGSLRYIKEIDKKAIVSK